MVLSTTEGADIYPQKYKVAKDGAGNFKQYIWAHTFKWQWIYDIAMLKWAHSGSFAFVANALASLPIL